MFYFIIFLILGLFGFLEITSIPRVYKSVLLICSFFLLWFIAGLKFEMGGDWPSYREFFLYVEPLEQVLTTKSPTFTYSYMEQGYKVLNSVIKSLGGSMQVVFFIIAFFNALLFFKGLQLYGVYPVLGALIYYSSVYFPLDMIAIRQAVAVQLFFISLYFIYQRRFWPYFLLVTIAFLFHRSAILLYPLYFVLHKEWGNKLYLLLFLFSACIFFLQVHWMTGLLNWVADQMGGHTSSIIKMYLSSNTYGVNRVLSVGVLINFLLFFLYMIHRKQLKQYRFYPIFFNLFLINVVVFFVFYEFIEISNRYRFYFLLSNVILLPYLITLYKDVYFKAVTYVGIVAFSFLYGRAVFLEEPSAIAFNPYQNYLIHVIFDTKSDGMERLKKSDKEYIESRKRDND
ncbi:EpsG family protein [Pedobacter sp.]|uniref:EpsG family protein n=1 Tax=Pedobacter sp. TaxID=1411316 RepID=UPI003D7F5EF8